MIENGSLLMIVNWMIFPNVRILATSIIILNLAFTKLLKRDDPTDGGKHSNLKLFWCLVRFGIILVYCYLCDRTFLFEKREK